MTYQKFCEVCGQELSEGIKFCPKCGDPVEQKTVPPTVESIKSIPSEKDMPPPIDYRPVPPPSTPLPKEEETIVKPKPIPLLQRSKRMGGGIPTLFGGLILLGLIGFQIFNKTAISLEAIILGLAGIIIGFLMLRVRDIKNFILVFILSLLLFVGTGYQFYRLMNFITNTFKENPAEITSRPDLIIYVIGTVFILYGFSRVFRSIFVSRRR